MCAHATYENGTSMFDTMTLTKIGGAFFGALLAFLLANWASSGLFAMHGGDGHGGEHQPGYSIATDEDDDAAVELEVAEVSFDEVYASADAGAGAALWRQCQACHANEPGVNGVGPYLHGVVGRDKGAVDGFSYSDTLATMEGDWTPENLSGFLENPREYAPGTAMSYSGMRDIEDRANLIAYLATLQ